ncbi:hypothetical protein BT63DRAFT_457716 [Microthyrium microscopicum]|uniref:Uncharacterized protein n=1 Tax=Microthyrium microscopicum TaxID=703497 RepID=A0A6A6U3P7_9PEZI|nr:hypothetical protein BT63DRAFT_457716 [Microthyrium microscopicum]
MQQPNLPHHSGHHVPVVSSPLVTIPKSSLPVLPLQSYHMKQSRPRLSLKTDINSTHLRTFGKGSSLRLDTLSAVDPTSRNTFSNGYEPNPGASNTRPKLALDLAVGQTSDYRQSPDTDSSRTPSNSSISSATTATSEQSALSLYELPKGITSILTNSLIPRTSKLRMSVSRPDISLSKRVSFRDPIQEDIKTKRYTLAHSDIEIVDSEEIKEGSLETTPTQNTISQTTPTDTTSNSSSDFQVPSAASTIYTSPPPRRKDRRIHKTLSRRQSSPAAPMRQKRDSSSSDDDEDSDESNSYPQTPIAGRCKRSRDWTWTLGKDESNGTHDVIVTSADDNDA